jgi:hypothetical protein
MPEGRLAGEVGAGHKNPAVVRSATGGFILGGDGWHSRTADDGQSALLRPFSIVAKTGAKYWIGRSPPIWPPPLALHVHVVPPKFVSFQSMATSDVLGAISSRPIQSD